jgi:hypothetical protein
MKKKIILFSLLLSFGNVINAQRVYGLVFHQGRSEPMAGVTISLLYSSRAEYQTKTDSLGNFKFRKVQPGIYSIKISGFAIADTVFNQVSISRDTTINMLYSVYCKYDKSAKDKKCPLCGKDDNVIPVRYGLIGATVLKKGKHALKNQRQIIDEFFPGGCIVTPCDPSWYCKRDQYEF